MELVSSAESRAPKMTQAQTMKKNGRNIMLINKLEA
jgi:hypothetical protein